MPSNDLDFVTLVRQRGGSLYTINKRFCLRDVIESNPTRLVFGEQWKSRVPITNSQFGRTSAQATPWFRLTSWVHDLAAAAWKSIGCNGLSVFLACDGRTAPCAGTGRKACPTPAHSGCRPYCYLHPGCRSYHYSQSSAVGDATPAASPCGGVNVGHCRTHGAEEDTGSDKRLRSRVRLHS